MRAPRLFLSILVMVAAAMLLAGCGAVSKSQYQKDVKKVIDKVEQRTDKLFASGQPSGKDLEEAGKAITDAADELEGIEPPSDVEKLHDNMVEDIRTLGESLDKLGPAMDKIKKDPSKATEIMKDVQGEQEKIVKATSRLEETRKAFVKKGYSVFKDKKKS